MTTLGIIYLEFWTKNPTNVEEGFTWVCWRNFQCVSWGGWLWQKFVCVVINTKYWLSNFFSRWPWFTMLDHSCVKAINWTQSLSFNRIFLHPPCLTISSLNIWNLLILILSKLCVILKNIFSKLLVSWRTSCGIGLKIHLDLCPKFYNQ